MQQICPQGHLGLFTFIFTCYLWLFLFHVSGKRMRGKSLYALEDCVKNICNLCSFWKWWEKLHFEKTCFLKNLPWGLEGHWNISACSNPYIKTSESESLKGGSCFIRILPSFLWKLFNPVVWPRKFAREDSVRRRSDGSIWSTRHFLREAPAGVGLVLLCQTGLCHTENLKIDKHHMYYIWNNFLNSLFKSHFKSHKCASYNSPLLALKK